MKQLICTISYNEEVMPDVHLISFESPYIANTAQPGQFITISCNDVLLRRPFSIHVVNSDHVSILFQKVGKGTTWLSKQQIGTKLDILGPLGSAFKIESQSKHLLLVGGGIGIAPLIFLAQRTLPKHSVTIVHGASTASLIYPLSSIFINSSTERDRKDSSSILNSRFHYITVTDDGSSGHKGVATDVVVDHLNWADQVFACGPTNMYVTMSVLCKNMQIAKSVNEPVELHEDNKTKLQRCQISLEMVMGCGIGSCYGCSVNTKDGMRTVCRDGPVFELCQVLWNKILI